MEACCTDIFILCERCKEQYAGRSSVSSSAKHPHSWRSSNRLKRCYTTITKQGEVFFFLSSSWLHFSAEQTTSSPRTKHPAENIQGFGKPARFPWARLASVVGNIVKNETSGVEEHHLQAALATRTVRIPIPGSIQLVENYAELYSSNRWRDTETYLQSAQTISEACSAALLDHDYTYFMDKADKTWLDNTNYQCHVEEQIAQETPSADTDDIFIRVSISEDEFGLVMGLFEILTGPKVRIMILIPPAGTPGFLVHRSIRGTPSANL
ncbi:hypothetical protein B0H14DRAFT_2570530 [Mycena olivaceomarginata]|nr:hypothetical protein B0H14DRAFT_2570530 [Mycena olivaceomarginata]